ncbi:Argonaute Ast1 variant [Operophtera brumata]|uniref:Argonaute Ast1 variant n=1 Tax=Operophtera brumata TaxID=104452 RepID=A0A0L7LUZ1_OPEBR|nr:Argonaute Ast1 variant [Operophtera brumata]
MHGTQGTPVEITSNFIRLEFKEKCVFEYEVRFEPTQDYKHLRFKLLNEHAHYFENKTFDGTTLYVPHMLPDEALNLVSTNPYDESKVNITIAFRRPRLLSEMIHLYNVLFKSIMKDLEMVRFGRQSYNPRSAIQIPQHKLEVWPGYVTAVDEYEGGLMLTLDSTHRVLRTQTVLTFIKDAYLVMLVPELCQLTGLTDEQRNDFRLMKDVATFTRISPNQRHAAFKQVSWGLSIAKETIDLTARTLPAEQLLFGNNVKVNGKPSAEWNNEVTRNAVMSAVDILRWVVLYVDRDAMKQPEMIKLPNDKTESYVSSIKDAIKADSNLQLVVTICPTSRDDRYAAIKKVCCAQYPVPSQVRAITQKILLQINCKLGGTLWHINIPFKSMTLWYSRVVIQQKGQEISDGLQTCFVEALLHFSNMNGKFPDKIIVYRYDFLIASQKVTQGTVTPTHYVVIYDDNDMPPDHCQRMTYKMCHLYYNWPGTVRVPAPCQYAHKLAFLIGQSVRQKPADVLCDKLYFL